MSRITTDRMSGVLGKAPKPVVVWQQQFDGKNEVLNKIARCEWREIPEEDLWEYFHDLSYQPLQPDLFRHLFPACLNFWYKTLMRNEGAERGDAELHYALVHGNIISKMLNETERQRLFSFFVDGFLDRVDLERGFHYERPGKSAHAWISRFNSLGLVAPVISPIWSSWWSMDSSGKAVSAMMYASGLIYFKGENLVYPAWTREKGGGGPYLTECDSSIFDTAWLDPNLAFMRSTLSSSYVIERMDAAAAALKNEPESAIATRIAKDARDRSDVIEIRIGDLLENLGRPQLARELLE